MSLCQLPATCNIFQSTCTKIVLPCSSIYILFVFENKSNLKYNAVRDSHFLSSSTSNCFRLILLCRKRWYKPRQILKQANGYRSRKCNRRFFPVITRSSGPGNANGRQSSAGTRSACWFAFSYYSIRYGSSR